jgi:ribosomal protein S12 methylthiotransferase accessory factor
LNLIYDSYKELPPKETIRTIKNILSRLGLSVIDRGIINNYGIYSCRIELAGCSIGTNGKGYTEDYCYASAYSEFMERLQTGLLFYDTVNIDFFKKYHNDLNAVFSDFDTESINELFSSPIETTQFSLLSHFRKLLSIEQQLNLLAMPYKRIGHGEDVLIPITVTIPVTGSTGYAAGNTINEASVQALSEILERYVTRETLLGRMPISLLDQNHTSELFPNETSLLAKIESEAGIKVKLYLPFSPINLPVIIAFFCDTNGTPFCIKYGCDPDIRIALQRCISEYFQGQTSTSTIKQTYSDYRLLTLPERISLFNTYGTVDGNSLCFKIMPSTSNTALSLFAFSSINEKLNYLLSLVSNLGFSKIYYKDYSIFGFPTVHFIIPGMSESFYVDESAYKLRKSNYNRKMAILNFPKCNYTDISNLLDDIISYNAFVLDEYNSTINAFIGLRGLNDNTNSLSVIDYELVSSIITGNIDHAIKVIEKHSTHEKTISIFNTLFQVPLLISELELFSQQYNNSIFIKHNTPSIPASFQSLFNITSLAFNNKNNHGACCPKCNECSFSYNCYSYFEKLSFSSL